MGRRKIIRSPGLQVRPLFTRAELSSESSAIAAAPNRIAQGTKAWRWRWHFPNGWNYIWDWLPMTRAGVGHATWKQD